MNEGSITRINYVEKIATTGKITKTTIEQVARDAGIFDEDNPSKYRPFVTVVGSGKPTPGVDEALKNMDVGEEKEFGVPPENAYGNRNPKLMDHVTQNVLRQKGINPVRGLPVRTNRGIAIIRSISGGRIRLDYNHPLAGREMHYLVEVLGEATDPETRIRWLIDRRLRRMDPDSHIINISEKEAEIELNTGELSEQATEAIRSLIRNDIEEHVPEIEKISFAVEPSEEQQEQDSSEAEEVGQAE